MADPAPVRATARAAAFLLLAACASAGPADLDRGGLGAVERSLNTKRHGYAVITDPTGSAPTPVVERFEVRPGDCGVAAGFSDCATDRERSELAQDRRHRSPPGTEAWYGWSLFLPDDLPHLFPAKTVFGQFHQTGARPLFMFLHGNDGLVLDNHVSRGANRLLIPESELRGRWHRFEVHARWSQQRDGFFRVFVNGALKAEHRGATMTAREVYLKYGVYRSFVSRYRAAFDTDTVPSQTALYANLRSAPSRNGLAISR